MLRGILRRIPTYTYWSLQRSTRGLTMVSFTVTVTRRNTFIGGTCAPPSALLVIIIIIIIRDSVTRLNSSHRIVTAIVLRSTKTSRKKSVTQELAARNENRVVFFRESARAGGVPAELRCGALRLVTESLRTDGNHAYVRASYGPSV